MILVGSGFALVVGTFLRLTMKDAVPYLSLFFYVTPPIVLTASAFILSGRMWALKNRRRAGILFVMGIVMLGWWRATTYQTPSSITESDPGSTKSVFFWNISYVKAGWPNIIREIQKYDPDIIGLVEVGNGYHAQQAGLYKAFPEHQPLFVGHGFLLVRGQWMTHKQESLQNHGDYAIATARFEDGSELDISIVDIYAYPFMPRGPALKTLHRNIDQSTERPVCFMGDFNTPPDSIFFDPFRVTHENTFEEKGEGYHVTWPDPVPLLCLDQIWCPQGTTRTAAYHSTPYSDHRIVTASFRLPPPDAPLNTKTEEQ